MDGTVAVDHAGPGIVRHPGGADRVRHVVHRRPPALGAVGQPPHEHRRLVPEPERLGDEDLDHPLEGRHLGARRPPVDPGQRHALRIDPVRQRDPAGGVGHLLDHAPEHDTVRVDERRTMQHLALVGHPGQLIGATGRRHQLGHRGPVRAPRARTTCTRRRSRRSELRTSPWSTVWIYTSSRPSARWSLQLNGRPDEVDGELLDVDPALTEASPEPVGPATAELRHGREGVVHEVAADHVVLVAEPSAVVPGEASSSQGRVLDAATRQDDPSAPRTQVRRPSRPASGAR